MPAAGEPLDPEALPASLTPADAPPDPPLTPANCRPSGWPALDLDLGTADPARLGDTEPVDAIIGWDRITRR